MPQIYGYFMKDMEEWISINLNTILIILGGNIRSCNVEMTDLLHKYKSLVYYGFFSVITSLV